MKWIQNESVAAIIIISSQFVDLVLGDIFFLNYYILTVWWRMFPIINRLYRHQRGLTREKASTNTNRHRYTHYWPTGKWNELCATNHMKKNRRKVSLNPWCVGWQQVWHINESWNDVDVDDDEMWNKSVSHSQQWYKCTTTLCGPYRTNIIGILHMVINTKNVYICTTHTWLANVCGRGGKQSAAMMMAMQRIRVSRVEYEKVRERERLSLTFLLLSPFSSNGKINQPAISEPILSRHVKDKWTHTHTHTTDRNKLRQTVKT